MSATGGGIIAAASTANYASIRIPHGSAPNSPVNGDMWSTTAGLYIRINGNTVGPVGTGGGTWGSITGTLSNQTDLQNALDGKQPLDADLTAIAALAGTTGLLKKTAADTWTLDTTTYAPLASPTFTGTIAGYSALLPSAVTSVTVGSELGTGSSLTQNLTGLTIGNTYVVEGISGAITSMTLDGTSITANDSGQATFIATATSHTVVGTGSATAISVKRVIPRTTGFESSVSGLKVSYTSDSVFLGGANSPSLLLNTGTDNVVIGNTAGAKMSSAAYNVAIGYGVLGNTANGYGNLGVGAVALGSFKNGAGNIAIGSAALYTLDSADGNVAIGDYAATYLTSGTQNVIIGQSSLYSATATSNNVAVGFGSLYSQLTNGNSTAVGHTSLYQSTGLGNTALGYRAGRAFTTGNYNTAIGTNAGFSSTATISGSVVIGTNSSGTGAQATASNQFVLGTSAHSVSVPGSLGITGKVTTAASTATSAGINIPHGTAPTAPVNGDLWSTTSGFVGYVNGGTVTIVTSAIQALNSLTTLGSTAGTFTLNMGAGATLSGNTKTVNVGTAGLSGSTTAINLGSAVSGATSNITLSGTVTLPSTTSIGNVSNTEIGYLDGVTSAIQTQIDSKADTTVTALNSLINIDTTSTASHTLNIGTGATANTNTKTINIGTAGASGSTTTINIGSSVSGSTNNIYIGGSINDFGANVTNIVDIIEGAVYFRPSTISIASVRIPHGTAPNAPENGDMWTTTAGLFARINGTTQQYAPLASPTFTGTPGAPTATAGTNTTQIATTAFVRGEVTALVDSAPGTLDTLNELAAALGDDPNFATTVSTSLGNKADKSGSVDIEITDATKGVILKSANGTRYRITVADDGSLTTTAV